MLNKRILGIYCQTNVIYNFETSDFESNMKTIFEYDVVIINFKNMNIHTFWELFVSQKEREFSIFFKNGGICFVILSTPEFPPLLFEKLFGWCPFRESFNIKSYKGLEIYNINKDFQFLFENVQYNLSFYFSDYPEDSIVLATNKPRNPISIIIPYYKGRCVILPSAKEPDVLYSVISLNIEKFYPKIEPALKPDWVNDYLTEQEKELFKKKEEIETELGRFSLYKQLLWETGERLESLVKNCFIELGMKVKDLSKDSACDFEIDLGNNITAVCEVKGLKNNVNREDMRQLLEYFIEKRDFEDRNVKGIFIVNHYRNISPSERGEPVTESAKRLASNYDFKVLTTIELYQYLKSFWQGTFSLDMLLKRLIKT